MIVTSQYRTSLNFAPEALAGAKSALKRLDKFRQQIVNGQFLLTLSQKGLKAFRALHPEP
jgi:cysteinyl-tRNA synthetase